MRSWPFAVSPLASRRAPPRSRCSPPSATGAPSAGSSAAARPSDAGADSDWEVIHDLVEVLGESGAREAVAGPAGHALGQPRDLAVPTVAQRDAGPDVTVQLVRVVVGRHDDVVAGHEPLGVVLGRERDVTDGSDARVAVALDVVEGADDVAAIAVLLTAQGATDPETIEAGRDPAV